MKIFVLNCGSSSFKYQLIDMQTNDVIASGKFERIGEEESFLVHKAHGKKETIKHYAKDHTEAIKKVLEVLVDKNLGVISNLEEIEAIGHRLVHGGDKIAQSVVIDDGVVDALEEYSSLAPLHNPPCIDGIQACRAVVPNIPMAGVFDTAFHQTIDKSKYLYPIDLKYYEKYKIRKYGFHGTSHNYVSQRLAQILNKDIKDLKIVTCHLGQGSSISAVDGGRCVETSMGLTPLGGFPMVTRSGDLDPSVVTYIMKKENLTPDEMEKVLNKQSGLAALSKMEPDFRLIEEKSYNDEDANIAIEKFTYEISSYIAKCMVALGGANYIIFTGGIGENQINIRKKIIEKLAFLGAKLDDEANKVRSEEIKISSDDSKIGIYVVPTNEELMIAKETMRLIGEKK